MMLALAFAAPMAQAQSDIERITIPFSDSSAPRQLIVEASMGAVTVRGVALDGNVAEASVEVRQRSGRPFRQRTAAPPGMHRIGGTVGGVDVTEANNVVRVSGGMVGLSSVDIVVEVPAATSVTVKSLNRSIRIDGISGEIEASNMSGEIEVQNASGSVVANSMNGKITVSLDSVMPDKPMSFSTMNGDIDVALPGATAANLKLTTTHGDMFTDFDVTLLPQQQRQQVQEQQQQQRQQQQQQREEQARANQARTRSQRAAPSPAPVPGVPSPPPPPPPPPPSFGRATYGTINGGGAELQFTTFNGNIVIRKK